MAKVAENKGRRTWKLRKENMERKEGTLKQRKKYGSNILQTRKVKRDQLYNLSEHSKKPGYFVYVTSLFLRLYCYFKPWPLQIPFLLDCMPLNRRMSVWHNCTFFKIGPPDYQLRLILNYYVEIRRFFSLFICTCPLFAHFTKMRTSEQHSY